MDREDLRKMLATMSIAGLVAGGGVALTAQPALGA